MVKPVVETADRKKEPALLVGVTTTLGGLAYAVAKITLTNWVPVCVKVPDCPVYVPATHGPPETRVSTITLVLVTDVTVAVLESTPEPAVNPDAEAVTVLPTTKPSVEETVKVAVAPPTATTTVDTAALGAEDTVPCISGLLLLIRAQ